MEIMFLLAKVEQVYHELSLTLRPLPKGEGTHSLNKSFASPNLGEGLAVKVLFRQCGLHCSELCLANQLALPFLPNEFFELF